MMRPIPSLGALVSELIDRLEQGTLRPGYSAPVQRGSAQGTVGIVSNPRDPSVHLLLITLDIMRAPQGERAAFFKRLLELNGTLLGRASFWVGEDDVVRLHSGRPLEDLDPSELVDVILWTSEQADYFDDVLLEEFGEENTI